MGNRQAAAVEKFAKKFLFQAHQLEKEKTKTTNHLQVSIRLPRENGSPVPFLLNEISKDFLFFWGGDDLWIKDSRSWTSWVKG